MGHLIAQIFIGFGLIVEKFLAIRLVRNTISDDKSEKSVGCKNNILCDP